MKYLGSPYPIVKHKMGYFHNDDDISQIKSDILSIIMTRPGERVMELDFGCPLESVNPNQDPGIISEQARYVIASALKRWEKRVQITEVVVDAIVLDNKFGVILDIQISFIEPTDLVNTHHLAIQIPLEI